MIIAGIIVIVTGYISYKMYIACRQDWLFMKKDDFKQKYGKSI